mgnify:CR=1 FL=1
MLSRQDLAAFRAEHRRALEAELETLRAAIEEAREDAEAARAQQLRDVVWFMETLRELRAGSASAEDGRTGTPSA